MKLQFEVNIIKQLTNRFYFTDVQMTILRFWPLSHFSHKVVHCSPIIKMIIDTLCKRCDDARHTTHSLYIVIEIKLFQTSVMPPFIKEDNDLPYPEGEPKWPQISPKALYHYFVIHIIACNNNVWNDSLIKTLEFFPKKLLLLFDHHFLVVELCWGVGKYIPT